MHACACSIYALIPLFLSILAFQILCPSCHCIFHVRREMCMQGSVYETPRQSMRGASMGSMSLPGVVRDEVEDAYPIDETTMTRPPIAGRRNLRNYRFQKPRTDFQTWEQAESALQNGVSVQELVRREFTSDFGPQSVRCAHLTSSNHLVHLKNMNSWQIICVAVPCIEPMLLLLCVLLVSMGGLVQSSWAVLRHHGRCQSSLLSARWDFL